MSDEENDEVEENLAQEPSLKTNINRRKRKIQTREKM